MSKLQGRLKGGCRHDCLPHMLRLRLLQGLRSAERLRNVEKHRIVEGLRIVETPGTG